MNHPRMRRNVHVTIIPASISRTNAKTTHPRSIGHGSWAQTRSCNRCALAPSTRTTCSPMPTISLRVLGSPQTSYCGPRVQRRLYMCTAGHEFGGGSLHHNAAAFFLLLSADECCKTLDSETCDKQHERGSRIDHAAVAGLPHPKKCKLL